MHKVGKVENCPLQEMCWSVKSCITLFVSCRLPMSCCITKASGIPIEGVKGIFSLDSQRIIQYWLSVIRTMRSISFWKESISFIPRGLCGLEAEVRVKLWRSAVCQSWNTACARWAAADNCWKYFEPCLLPAKFTLKSFPFFFIHPYMGLGEMFQVKLISPFLQIFSKWYANL